MVKLSLREGPMNDIVNLERYIFEGQKHSINRFMDKFNELRERTQYKPIGELTNILSEFMQEVVNNSMLQSYYDWSQGQNSFVGIASRFKVGELAIDEAKRYELIIESIIQESFLDLNTYELTSLEDTNISSEDLNEIGVYCSELHEELEDLRADCRNRIESLREENIIANGILPLSEYQFNILEIVAGAVGEISESLVEHFIELLKKNREIMEEAAKRAFNTASRKGEYDGGVETFDDDFSPNHTGENPVDEEDNKKSTGRMAEALKDLGTLIEGVKELEDEPGNSDNKKLKHLDKIRKWMKDNPEAAKLLNAGGKAGLKMLGKGFAAKHPILAEILSNLDGFLGDDSDEASEDSVNKGISAVGGALKGLNLDAVDEAKIEGKEPPKKQVMEDLIQDFGKGLVREIIGGDPSDQRIHPMYRNSELTADDFVNGRPNKFVPEIDDYEPKYGINHIGQAVDDVFDNVNSKDIDKEISLNLESREHKEILKSEISNIRELLETQGHGFTLPNEGNMFKLLDIAAGYADDTIHNLEGDTERNDNPLANRIDFSRPINEEEGKLLNRIIDDLNVDELGKDSLGNEAKHIARNLAAKEYGYPYVDKNNNAWVSNPEELASAIKGNQENIFVPDEFMEQVKSTMKLKFISNFIINILFALILVAIPTGVLLTPFTGGLSIPVTASALALTGARLTKLDKEDIMNILALVATGGKTFTTLLFTNYILTDDTEEQVHLRRE